MKIKFAKSASGLLAKLLNELMIELDIEDKVYHRSIKILETSKDIKLKNSVKYMSKPEISFTFIPILLREVLELKKVLFVLQGGMGDIKHVNVSDVNIVNLKDVNRFLYKMMSEIVLKNNPNEKYIYNQSSKLVSITGVVRGLKKAKFNSIGIGFIVKRKHGDVTVIVEAKI